MEPAKNFSTEKNEIKINVVGLLINSFDKEFFKPNIHGCRKNRLKRCLTLSKERNDRIVCELHGLLQ